jgi:hypothetical protein
MLGREISVVRVKKSVPFLIQVVAKTVPGLLCFSFEVGTLDHKWLGL